jgi:hypothetical protein
MTLDASEAFYAKLGFMREASHENYLILSDGKGWNIHLTIAVEGGLIPGRNPFGLYLYSENVDGLAASLGDLVVHGQENKPWGCTNSRSPIPMKSLCGLAGQRPEADPLFTRSHHLVKF